MSTKIEPEVVANELIELAEKQKDLIKKMQREILLGLTKDEFKVLQGKPSTPNEISLEDIAKGFDKFSLVYCSIDNITKYSQNEKKLQKLYGFFGLEYH